MATTHMGTTNTGAASGTAGGASDIIIQSVTARNLQNNKAKVGTLVKFKVPTSVLALCFEMLCVTATCL